MVKKNENKTRLQIKPRTQENWQKKPFKIIDSCFFQICQLLDNVCKKKKKKSKKTCKQTCVRYIYENVNIDKFKLINGFTELLYSVTPSQTPIFVLK